MNDQFGLQPNSGTTSALTYLNHHTVTMLENCDYVLCLMIDFSHVFDLTDHPMLLSQLSQLDLPDFAFNWIVSFLTDRTQAVAVVAQ